MKVTSLDVSNLLSFGEFHLDLDDRLTVLVGPNGAGKTNVVRVLDLVTKLVDWADERSRSGAAPPTPADTMLSSYVQAVHDGSAPGSPMEIRLGVQFTTPSERTRIVAFVRAALLATLSDESHAGDEGRKARLVTWVTDEVDEETLLPLFTGTLAFRHPGYEDALWEARYEVEVEVDGSLYDWVLYTPSYWASIVTHGAVIGPTTSETKLSEALFSLSANSSPPPPLPDPLPHFTLSALCPPGDKKLTNLVVRLGTSAINDQHEPFRAAANLLGFRVFAGGQLAFGLARALRFNLMASLLVLGEQFRGLGVGPTEQGALPIWCAKSKAAEELGTPAAGDIGFYSAPGDSGFRTILSVLHGFGIAWVIVCDGKSFDVETNWSNQIFRQIEQAGVDLPELKRFIEHAGSGGRNQRSMTQALWDEQVALGARHGVFTLSTIWTGSGEAVEGFIEGAAPGKLVEAKAEVGGSKIRKGRWVAQQTDCPVEVDDLFRQIVAALDRGLVDAPSRGEIPSQPDGTVAR